MFDERDGIGNTTSIILALLESDDPKTGNGHCASDERPSRQILGSSIWKSRKDKVQVPQITCEDDQEGPGPDAAQPVTRKGDL